MDPFTHLNYCYPGTPNAARLHVSQQLQGSPHRVVQNTQSIQDRTRPGDGYMSSDSSRMAHARCSLDATAAHSLHPQQKGVPIGLRGAVHSDSLGSMKLYYHVDESANLLDQYVPSSSDKITCTDHRPLDEIFGNMRSSSGWPQARLGSVYPSRNATSHGHARHSSVLTYPLPTRPEMDGVVQIPLLAVDNQMSGTGLVVDFRCSDWGIGVQVEGMLPYADLLSRT